MSYEETSQFSGYLSGPAVHQSANPMMQHIGAANYNEQAPPKPVEKDTSFYHGEALARDYWAERYGPWIVLAFSAAFSLFLVGMVLLGQTPGKSFSLKGHPTFYNLSEKALVSSFAHALPYACTKFTISSVVN